MKELAMVLVILMTTPFVFAYNRYAAVNYAWTYVWLPNNAYHQESNDCTNFVSQCLRAGGWQVVNDTIFNRNRTDRWWPYDLGRPASYTWINADYMKWFIQVSGRGYFISDWHGLQPGDVIGADWGPGGTPPGTPDGTLDHMMIVLSNNGNDITYAQHSSNKVWTLRKVMAFMPGARFYYFHIRD